MPPIVQPATSLESPWNTPVASRYEEDAPQNNLKLQPQQEQEVSDKPNTNRMLLHTLNPYHQHEQAAKFAAMMAAVRQHSQLVTPPPPQEQRQPSYCNWSTPQLPGPAEAEEKEVMVFYRAHTEYDDDVSSVSLDSNNRYVNWYTDPALLPPDGPIPTEIEFAIIIETPQWLLDLEQEPGSLTLHQQLAAEERDDVPEPCRATNSITGISRPRLLRHRSCPRLRNALHSDDEQTIARRNGVGGVLQLRRPPTIHHRVVSASPALPSSAPQPRRLRINNHHHNNRNRNDDELVFMERHESSSTVGVVVDYLDVFSPTPRLPESANSAAVTPAVEVAQSESGNVSYGTAPTVTSSSLSSLEKKKKRQQQQTSRASRRGRRQQQQLQLQQNRRRSSETEHESSSSFGEQRQDEQPTFSNSRRPRLQSHQTSTSMSSSLFQEFRKTSNKHRRVASVSEVSRRVVTRLVERPLARLCSLRILTTGNKKATTISNQPQYYHHAATPLKNHALLSQKQLQVQRSKGCLT